MSKVMVIVNYMLFMTRLVNLYSLIPLFVLILLKSEKMIVKIISACFEQIMDSDRSNTL